MALTSNFQNMLNEYAPDKMFTTELFARDYVLTRCKKDDKWLCGDNSSENAYLVPFQAGRASSVRFGAYTETGDVAQMTTVRGKIQNAKLLTGTLKFFETDLMRNGKLSPQNMMDSLLDQLPDMMKHMKNVVSTSFCTGIKFANITSVTNQGSGTLVVDRPDRFQIGQLVEIFSGTTGVYADNGGSGGTVGNELFVKSVDINTKSVVFSLTRGGGAATLSGIAVNDGCHHHDSYLGGSQAFANLRSILLSNANGGDASYLGFAKTLYPYLQAYNYDGSSMTATNMLKKLFDFSVQASLYTQAAPSSVMMSKNNFGICCAILESQKGAYSVEKGDTKGVQYGWKEIKVGSNVAGSELTLVGVNEMPDDVMYAPNFDSVVFASNGGLQKVMGMDGNSTFEERGKTGRSYLQDVRLWGELIIKKPCDQAAIFGIPTLSIA